MRFDDSLDTVLAADLSTAFGRGAAWRQLVDLAAQRRIPCDAALLARLTELRAQVPAAARTASARAIAHATPPVPLVAFFAVDEIAVAAPLLREASLDADDWITILPELGPAARAILRHRRDLPDAVVRAIASYGPVDFVLGDGATPSAQPAPAPAAMAEPAPGSQSTFTSLGNVARGLPVVAEALRRAADPGDAAEAPADDAKTPGTFQIADLVARIAAYQRKREIETVAPDAVQAELFAIERAMAETFRFEADASGILRWVEGAPRGPLIGLSLDFAEVVGASQVDGVAAGAFRRRAAFSDARLFVGGTSEAAGQWRISGVPVFDRDSGRFTGYRGTARRPRADERAEPAPRSGASDALRQLVHELRTPANAIAGFAEMIESELLGPVPPHYRAQATTIREQAADLLGAIDDIDMAARIESAALDLRSGVVPVAPLLERIARDLDPLAQLRGAALAVDSGPAGLAIAADDRAVERLVARLLATLVSSAGEGETLAIGITAEEAAAILSFTRPAALAAYADDALLTIDAEAEAERAGAPLLGTGFALRLARNLAVELGGALEIGDTRLTLRLPAALVPDVEQASLN